jgi:hypothetical protein
MDQKAQSATERVYKDLQPYFEWNEDEVSATLVLMLPGMFYFSHLPNPFGKFPDFIIFLP